MAYAKTVWVDGSDPFTPASPGDPKINAANLNKIENELETLDNAISALGGDFVVTATYANNAWSVDKTFAQIKAAYEGGATCVLVMPSLGYVYQIGFVSSAAIVFFCESYSTANQRFTLYAFQINSLDVITLKSDNLQKLLTFDATPTSASTNPVTSGGVYTALAGKEDVTTYPSESSTTYTLVENEVPDFGEVATLTITCPLTGLYGFTFESGSTATTLTMTGITMPDDWTVEANTRYEISILNGYGLAQGWSTI